MPSVQLPAGCYGSGMAAQVCGPSTAARGAVSRKGHPAHENEVSAISHVLMGLKDVLLLAAPAQPVCNPKGWCGDTAPCCVGLVMHCPWDGLELQPSLCSRRAAVMIGAVMAPLCEPSVCAYACASVNYNSLAFKLPMGISSTATQAYLPPGKQKPALCFSEGEWVSGCCHLLCLCAVGRLRPAVLCIHLLTATNSRTTAQSQCGFQRTNTWRLLAPCARGPVLSPCDAQPCVRGWNVRELLGTAGAVGQSCGHGLCRGCSAHSSCQLCVVLVCEMQSCDVPAQRSPNRGAINSWVRSLGMGEPALCGWVLHWLLLC